MSRGLTYRGFCMLLVFLCVFLTGGTQVKASKTEKELQKAENEIKKIEEQKKEAEGKVSGLKQEEGQLQGELASLNKKMEEAAAALTDLEAQLLDKEQEIAETKVRLEEAVKEKEAQYEAMKLRIRFMYEKGSEDLFTELLSSASISDFLNKAEYFSAISRYDREMLDKYEAVCIQVSETEKKLEEEHAQLTDLQTQMQDKKDQIDGLISDTKGSIGQKQAQINDAAEDVAAYEEQIEQMKAYEAQLEAQKAAEDKKRMEEIKRQEKENKGSGAVNASAGDAQLLAALVECEAGGEGYDGQLAVASVVVNRVRSSHFPNSVAGVIYQSGQFSPVASGRFAAVLARGASGQAARAANEVLAGNVTIGSLYFRQVSSGMEGTVIGNHVFY